MSKLLGALKAALFSEPVIPPTRPLAVPAQSVRPVPAVPAAISKHDFHWEKYVVRLAPNGNAFYVFDGQQPVGILVKGAVGQPELFPVITGAAREELRASLKRYEQANGTGARPASATATTASIAMSPFPSTARDGAPPVSYDSDGAHVSLNDGTTVHFLPPGIKVTMPAAAPAIPPTTLGFSVGRNGETAITMGGQPVNCERRGPIWDGLKVLVLQLALGRATQAARLADNAPGRPAGAPDYVALVAGIGHRLD